EINRALAESCRRHRGAYLLDYAGLMARHGAMSWFDERMWNFSRLPISAPCLIHMSDEWLRFVIPLAHRTAKVLVVDLDNTLWGGVIGEDGMSGIEIGDDHPGAGFKELQSAIFDLHKRGIVLAICSKNNPDDAMAVLRDHPEMILKPAHFAAQRIDWEPKPGNIRAIAEELNLGLDSFVFLDDNPAERDAVGFALPEVRIIDLPGDPAHYAAALRRAPHFEVLHVTEEDRVRGGYYAEERARNTHRERVSSPEEFLRTLEIAVEIAPVDAMTVPRAAQLTQKTNQFNLTTRRYSEAEITPTGHSPF
ncbi:MAG: HAD-IIIC family phosphatase, partial [Erythrobacter sp.]|nr:HAD-IIIC family phosphatase [Erythrobacter sp.]